MTTATLRKRIVKRIEKLPPKDLIILNEIMDSLVEDVAATKELLEIPGFQERLKQAEKEILEGKVYDFDKIRRNV